MLFKILLTISTFVFSLNSNILAETSMSHQLGDTGKSLFDKHCGSCHGMQPGMDMSKRLGPTISMVKLHYIGTYSDEFSFVNAIVNWVEKPNPDNTMMRGAIRRFKLMPKIVVDTDTVEKIAEYIYNIETSAGSMGRMRQRHGH